MSVPSSSYLTEKANFDTTMVEVDVYLAKLLQNTTPTTGEPWSGQDWGDGYFNSDDSDATKKTKILDIFKLDGFCRLGTTEKNAFVGYVRILPTPSVNASYHNTSRFSGRRFTDQATGYTYEILNDAGLNVKPTLNVNVQIDNTLPSTENNGFKITAKYRSAYYLGSTKFGIKWREQGVGNYVEAPSYGTLASKEISDKIQFITDVDPTDTLQIIAGKTYEILAFITNQEGETIFQMNNVIANTISTSVKYAAVRTLEAFMYATQITTYRDRRLLEGSNFYKYSDATGVADDGYYIYNQSGGTYYYYEIVNGKYYGSGTYSPRAQVAYYGYGSTYSNAVQDAVNNGWQLIPGRVMWYDESTNKFYDGENSGNYVYDGYYILSDSADGEGIYENYKIVNGEFVGAHPNV